MKSINAIAISTTFILLVIGIIVIGLNSNPSPTEYESKQPYEENGKQIVEIFAKGGYWPREVTAKAGQETIFRVITKNTFDCSMALSIPSISYSGYLNNTDTLDIPVPPQAAGETILGTCSMGMYRFKVNFE